MIVGFGRQLMATALMAAVLLAIPLARAQAVSIAELDRGLLGTCTGCLDNASATAGGSMAKTLLVGEGNAITRVTDLTGSLAGYSALWLSNNVQASGSGWSGAELANLGAFLASGKKVVMFADKAGGTDFIAYINAIVGVAGGAYSTNTGGAFPVAGNTLGTAEDNLLTAGLTATRFAGVSDLDGTAGSPEIVFADGGLNIAGLYHTGGGGSLLAIMDTDFMTNNATFGLHGTLVSGYPGVTQNEQFILNISDWLNYQGANGNSGVPEPGTLALLGFGLSGLAGMCRLRVRRRR